MASRNILNILWDLRQSPELSFERAPSTSCSCAIVYLAILLMNGTIVSNAAMDIFVFSVFFPSLGDYFLR